MVLNGFKKHQFNEDFIKNLNDDNDIGYFIEGGVWYPEELHEHCKKWFSLFVERNENWKSWKASSQLAW